MDCGACVGGCIAELKQESWLSYYIQLFSHKTHLWNSRDIFISLHAQISLMLPACILLLKKMVLQFLVQTFLKIPAPSFFRHLSYGVKQVWRRALLLSFWRLQMRAKYQAEISSSEEATFTQTPPGTGIILFATDLGQRLKIRQAWVTVEFSSEEKLLGYG